MIGRREQIEAILAGTTFPWAQRHLPPGRTIDDVRFRDLITVSEQDVLEHVHRHGFDPRVVAEGDATRGAENCHVLEQRPDGRWSLFFLERGRRFDEETYDDLPSARRAAVHLLYVGAKISLNHRYRLAHPDEDLPLPSDMD